MQDAIHSRPPNALDFCGKTNLLALFFAKSSFVALIHGNLG